MCRQAAQEEAIALGGQGIPEVLNTFYLQCLIKEKLTNMYIPREEQKARNLENVSHKEGETQWPRA